jgi:hypothetical protein
MASLANVYFDRVDFYAIIILSINLYLKCFRVDISPK